jgi:hypothetical protein
VDDALKFVQREIRRGNRYDGIVMDPPSYGRGPKGELWHLEDSIHELISLTASILSEDPSFYLVNSYTTGLSGSAVSYLVQEEVVRRFGGTVSSDIKHDKLIADGFDVENIGTSSFAEHTLVIPDGSSLKIGGDFTVGALIMGRTRIAAGDYTAAELGAVYGNVSGDGVVHVLGLTDGFAVTVR